MLSDNIRTNRKKINMSQDELAERLGVSRQSVSLWETSQTQPTIDNIIALSKIFNISTDTLLGNTDSAPTPRENPPEEAAPKKKRKAALIIAICVAAALVIGAIVFAIIAGTSGGSGSGKTSGTEDTTAPVAEVIDLFAYCKDFAIARGSLSGDYCIYQQPATTYGGYEDEYFSISYWADSDMVEFCLHCPLSDTQSHNFYLRMRGGFDGTYEYASSKYYRDTGESFRFAMGHIDPAVFYDGYPISCDQYDGSPDGQTDFMEQSRVGICDLIRCLEEFVTVENMMCEFSDFGFVNF